MYSVLGGTCVRERLSVSGSIPSQPKPRVFRECAQWIGLRIGRGFHFNVETRSGLKT